MAPGRPSSIIFRAPAWQIRKAASRLIRRMVRQLSKSWVRKEETMLAPAQLTRASSLPNLSTARRTVSGAEAGSVKSAVRPSTALHPAAL